ncbi:MAG: Rieske (2Fe-2S) protein [Bacteroidia bacterium]
MFRTVIRWHRIFASADEAVKRIPPKQFSVLYVGGRKVCVVNTTSTENEATPDFSAIEERCPHNGFSLSKGWITTEADNSCAIVCPLHRYSFDVKTGRRKNGGGEAARAFPVEVRDDGVFLGTEEMEWGWFRKKD